MSSLAPSGDSVRGRQRGDGMAEVGQVCAAVAVPPLQIIDHGLSTARREALRRPVDGSQGVSL